MQLKKWFVSLLAVAVASVSFALPAPIENNDPAANLFEQYMPQIEEMNKMFDSKILPPLKEMLKLAQEVASSDQTELTAQQEKTWNTNQEQVLKALRDFVEPSVQEVDLAQFSKMLKQLGAMEQSAADLTQEDFVNMMMSMTALSAIMHFEMEGLLTPEEIELANVLFFSDAEAQ